MGKCDPNLAEPDGAKGKISLFGGWEGRTEWTRCQQLVPDLGREWSVCLQTLIRTWILGRLRACADNLRDL